MRGRKKRVLVLTTTLPSVEGDPTPSFVLDLAQEMAEKGGMEVTIVAPAAGYAPNRERFGAVEVCRFRYLPGRWGSLGATTAIVPAVRARPLLLLQVPFLLGAFAAVSLREAWRVRPNVIHAHWIIPIGAWAVLLRRMAGLRGATLVVTCHGADVFALKGKLWDHLRTWVVSHADLVLPVSAEMTAKLGVHEDRVVPMGAARVFTRGRWAPSDGAPLLFVGRLDRKKGVSDLLQAIALTERVGLRIVGEGPLRGELEQQARALGITERVVFVGGLHKAQVAAEMWGALALVLPSVISADGDREGTPTVIMEAALARVPIIASYIGGVRDVLSDGVSALLVEPGNPAALARAINRAVSETGLLESIRDGAAREVAPRADMTTVALRYLKKLEPFLEETL